MRTVPVILTVIAIGGCSLGGQRPGAGERAGTPSLATPPVTSAAISASAPSPLVAGCDSLFVPPPSGDLLCNEHVLGNHMEIHWRSYGLAEDRHEVFRPYWEGASRYKCSLVTKPPLLAISSGDQRLEAFDAAPGGYPTCGQGPSQKHRTVVVISVKHDR